MARVPFAGHGHQLMAQTPAYQVGLNFGTHASGFSTAVYGSDPRFQELYPDQPEPYCKTLSQLLYSKALSSDWQPVAWGWSAYAVYQSLSATERTEYLLLDRFKLCLAEGYNDSMGACRLPAGLTPVRVIADYLRYLKEFTLSKLSIQWGSKSITAENVMWALTIPAAWTETAEQSMRQAAVSAGIVSHPGSRNLILLYEPEAAAMAIIKQQVPPLPFTEGSTFVVVDAGGGTVDITAHEVTRQDGQLALSELTCAVGVMAGSTNIDDSFQQYVTDLFGPEDFDAWFLEHPEMFSKIRHKTWEVAKRTFDGSKGVTLDIPGRMLKSLPDCVVERLEDQGCFDELVVSLEDMQGWFDIIVNEILQAVRKSLDRVATTGNTVDYMLVVGGFGASPYLIAKLRGAFGEEVQEVVCPGVPSQAVLKGAVLYAQSPSTVYARRCKFAYGVGCVTSWHYGLPREKMVVVPTTQRKICLDYFSRMVAFDELVENDQVVEHTFTPLGRHDSSIGINIHACSNNDDMYTTDKSMRQIATLELPIKDPTAVDPPEEYNIDVSFSFGSTEFHVVAKDRQTGQEIEADVVFIAS